MRKRVVLSTNTNKGALKGTVVSGLNERIPRRICLGIAPLHRICTPKSQGCPSRPRNLAHQQALILVLLCYKRSGPTKRTAGKLGEEVASNGDAKGGNRGGIMPCGADGRPRGGNPRVARVRIVEIADTQRGGKKASLGDEEPVSSDAERGVMMEASPASAFKVAQAEFLFQFLVISFHDPAMLGDPH